MHANACWCSDRHAAKRGKGLKRRGYLLCGKNLFRSIARITLCGIKIARRRKKVVEVCAGSVEVRKQGHCALLLDGRFTAPSCVALVVRRGCCSRAPVQGLAREVDWGFY